MSHLLIFFIFAYLLAMQNFTFSRYFSLIYLQTKKTYLKNYFSYPS